MKRLLIALIALWPSFALAQWQVNNNSIPLGKGAGKVGFGAVIGSAGAGAKCLTDTVPPAFTTCPPPTPQTAANLNYTAPGTGGTVQTQARFNQNILWAHDYGAVCDGVTNDAAAFQNLINAAITNKSAARFNGLCKINTALSITGAIDFGGVGQAYNFVAAATSAGSGLLVAANINAIEIDTQNPVYLHDFSCAASAVTTGKCIQVDYSAGGCVAQCLNYGSSFRRLFITGFANNFHFIRAGVWVIDALHMTGCTTTCLIIEDRFNGDAGDNSIINSDFQGASSGVTVIQWKSGGGFRYINNKVNGGGTAICFCSNSNANTGVFNISNNSFEGVVTTFSFIRDAANTKLLVRLSFSNNEMTAGAAGYCMYSPTDATGVWLQALNVTGGSCTVLDSSVAGISLDSVTGFVLSSIFFEGAAGTPPRLAIGANGTAGTIGVMSWNGTWSANALNGNRTVTCSAACN